MVLTVQTFKDVIGSLRTSKEGQSSDVRAVLPSDVVTKETIAEENRKELVRRFPQVEESFIDQVILVRKGKRSDVEELLEAYVTFRRENDWGLTIKEEDIHPAVVQANPHYIQVCPETGMNMVVVRYGAVDVDKAPAREFHKHGQMVLENITRGDPIAQENGIAMKLDFSGASFGILTKLNGDDLKRGLSIFRSFPVKVKKVYVCNANFAMRATMKAVLLVASKGVRSKVEFL